MSPTYDLIVLGTGGVGSAVAWMGARRGARVLALDTHHPPHPFGSSHGQTRAIRMAYFEHPDYVPLLRRAYALWDETEILAEQPLFVRCGLLQAGPANGKLVAGVRRAAASHQLPLRELSPREAQTEFADFRFRDSDQVLLEANAGYLRVDDCVAAQVRLAERFGADLRFGERVQNWQADGRGFHLVTDQAAYWGERLAICCGPWARQVGFGLEIPLRVIRKSVYFYPPRETLPRDNKLSLERLPVYFFETPSGFFYGFPAIDGRGVKVGRHSGAGPEYLTPVGEELAELAEDSRSVADFVANTLPQVQPIHQSRSDCWYTMSPDEHFLVDRINVPGPLGFALGLSGHGFKFAPVLGEILVDLLLQNNTLLPVEFLSPRRFQNTSLP